MYGSETPWGYIHQKKATEQANYEKDKVKIENKKLRNLIKKMVNNQELSKKDQEFLKEIE